MKEKKKKNCAVRVTSKVYQQKCEFNYKIKSKQILTGVVISLLFVGLFDFVEDFSDAVIVEDPVGKSVGN